jgi:hypothetical protein
MKVDCYFIEVNGKVGCACSVCGAEFFDRMSEGKHQRMLESACSLFIEHAEEAHQSTGGRFCDRPGAVA